MFSQELFTTKFIKFTY